mgnify:CR=1 FL=1
MIIHGASVSLRFLLSLKIFLRIVLNAIDYISMRDQSSSFLNSLKILKTLSDLLRDLNLLWAYRKAGNISSGYF